MWPFDCSHAATYREIRSGTLHLVCWRCDRAFPVALSDPQQAARLAKAMKRSAKAMKVNQRVQGQPEPSEKVRFMKAGRAK